VVALEIMRIVVAMSGGVDSSVAAALLAEQGHEVIGLSMQLYDQTTGDRTFGTCCTLDDLHDARRVARTLGIPHYILNFERQFDEQVVSNFVREYSAGRTPIPCARCNSDLKFATLLTRALGLGAEAVATGHYARVERDAVTGRPGLKRGIDPAKDQSYFLFSLTASQLAHAVFPVGDRPKTAVRDIAKRLCLPVADKPDSQEICFLPDGDYADFVLRHAPEGIAGGAIVNERGDVVGRHEGIHRFTVGQRKGLGVSGSRSPLYVLELRPADRQVVVGPKAALERTALTASDVNWIVDPAGASVRAAAQIRYRHRAAPARIEPLGDHRARVEFEAPQVAITPGQAVVFYDGDTVLGGGWID
jgi:tRNA-specific 2-thiouridylase